MPTHCTSVSETDSWLQSSLSRRTPDAIAFVGESLMSCAIRISRSTVPSSVASAAWMWEWP